MVILCKIGSCHFWFATFKCHVHGVSQQNFFPASRHGETFRLFTIWLYYPTARCRGRRVNKPLRGRHSSGRPVGEYYYEYQQCSKNCYRGRREGTWIYIACHRWSGQPENLHNLFEVRGLKEPPPKKDLSYIWHGPVQRVYDVWTMSAWA